jgi:uncharacterized protein YneF (UPF0154 family)
VAAIIVAGINARNQTNKLRGEVKEFQKQLRAELLKDTSLVEQAIRMVLTDAGVSKSIWETIFLRSAQESQTDFQKKFKDELLENRHLFETCMRNVLSDQAIGKSIWTLVGLYYVSKKDLKKEIKGVETRFFNAATANPIMTEKFRKQLREEE